MWRSSVPQASHARNNRTGRPRSIWCHLPPITTTTCWIGSLVLNSCTRWGNLPPYHVNGRDLSFVGRPDIGGFLIARSSIQARAIAG